MKEYHLGDISLTIDIQLFVLIDFLNQNGMKITSNGLDIYITAPLYEKIIGSKVELKTKETVMLRENELLVDWLNGEITKVKGLESNFNQTKRLNILNEELKKAKHISMYRYMMYQETKSNQLWRSSLESLSSIEDSAYNGEYEIHNNTGYVTSASGISEARDLARQYNGYIVDEGGNKI